ncbi:hypothetical protein Tco_0847406 [Tanacetum coccineum]
MWKTSRWYVYNQPLHLGNVLKVDVRKKRKESEEHKKVVFLRFFEERKGKKEEGGLIVVCKFRLVKSVCLRKYPYLISWYQSQVVSVAMTGDKNGGDDFEGLFEAAHEPARRQHQRDDYRLKVDLPFFNGSLNIKDFLDWIAEVERFFEFAKITGNKQVELVAYCLKGGASSWWEQVQNQRKRLGKQPTRSWPKMKRMLMGRFLPPHYD